MNDNLFTEKQIEYMYSNSSFFRFVNDYFSTYSLTNQKVDLKINSNSFSEAEMNIYIRIVLSNLEELRRMLSSIETSLSYVHRDGIKTFEAEIHGRLQVQKYLLTKTKLRYPREYPCQIKERTLTTPENMFLVFIIQYILELLDRFYKRLTQYKKSQYLSEKLLVEEYKRNFQSFIRKKSFKECIDELMVIKKEHGSEFPESILNEIKTRSRKGKIRNYQSYKKFFDWYWKYKEGAIELDKNKTLQLLRYSDDFCNKLFELWCLYTIKETFINEFGMSVIDERNIMKADSCSVFSLKTNTGGIVDIFYQKGASLYWDDRTKPRWRYIENKKSLRGIPDISIKYKANATTLIMIDLKNRIRSIGNNSEEIYKMIGYFDNFENMFQKEYSNEIKRQAILVFRNDETPYSESLISDNDSLINIYTVGPVENESLNSDQFKKICQCILNTQGIDGKTTEVFGNYQKEKARLSSKINKDDTDI